MFHCLPSGRVFSVHHSCTGSHATYLSLITPCFTLTKSFDDSHYGLGKKHAHLTSKYGPTSAKVKVIILIFSSCFIITLTQLLATFTATAKSFIMYFIVFLQCN